MDISEFSTTELIEELAQRANDRIIIAFEFVSDGGETLLRFYTGKNNVSNLGLTNALRLYIEHQYVQTSCQYPEDD
jgi:hypothetical protein